MDRKKHISVTHLSLANVSSKQTLVPYHLAGSLYLQKCVYSQTEN